MRHCVIPWCVIPWCVIPWCVMRGFLTEYLNIQHIFSQSLFICLFLCLSLSICLSVSLSLCLSVFLSLCLFVSFSLCLSVSLSFCLSLSLYLTISLSLSNCVCVSLSLFPLFLRINWRLLFRPYFPLLFVVPGKRVSSLLKLLYCYNALKNTMNYVLN